MARPFRFDSLSFPIPHTLWSLKVNIGFKVLLFGCHLGLVPYESKIIYVSRALTFSCWPLGNLFIFCAFYFSFYSTLTHKVALFMWIYTRAMYDQKQHVMLISFLLDLPTSMNESWIRSGAAMCLNCLFFLRKGILDFHWSMWALNVTFALCLVSFYTIILTGQSHLFREYQDGKCSQENQYLWFNEQSLETFANI